MAGKLACGYLAERVGIIRTVILTEAATGGGILLTLLLPDLAVYALLPFIGVALNGTSSVLYGTIGDLVESDRQPRAFGLRSEEQTSELQSLMRISYAVF